MNTYNIMDDTKNKESEIKDTERILVFLRKNKNSRMIRHFEHKLKKLKK